MQGRGKNLKNEGIRDIQKGIVNEYEKRKKRMNKKAEGRKEGIKGRKKKEGIRGIKT